MSKIELKLSSFLMTIKGYVMSSTKGINKAIIKTDKPFLIRKNQMIDLIKNDELKGVRLDEHYVDEVLKHDWLIDKYISKFGFVSDECPENTFKAYSLSIEKNYPILIPVQMIDDGEIVCFSHKTLSSVTKESGYITKMTLNEIKNINIGESEEKIPTLEESLDFIKGQVPVIIEIYNDSVAGRFEQKVADIIEKYIEKYDLFDSVAIMSLNPYTLEWFLNQAPWIPRILRSGKFKVKMFGSIKAKKLTKLKLSNIALPDYICYNAKDLPCKYIKKVKPVGIIAYNVKSQNEYMEIAKYCDNIIFDGFEPSI